MPQTPIPAYMRIRNYVIALVNNINASGENKKIMSEHELCRTFKVSRVTVRNALKELIDEGVLIAKRGMGTFVNPAWEKCKGRKTSTIGIISGAGMHVAYDYLYGTLASGIIQKTVETGMLMNIINFASHDPANIANELEALNLVGFIWMRPIKEHYLVIENLKAKNIPVFVVENLDDGNFDYVKTDFFDLGYKVGAKLLEDNLSKVCIATDKKHTAPAKGIIQAFKEKGLPFENSNILCKETKHETGFYKKLETFIMEKKNMDALWIMEPVEYEALTVIDNHFEELSHLKLIIRNGTYFRNHNDKIKPYLTINFPYFEQGIKAASAFIDKIKNGYDDHIKINIKMDI